MIVKCLNDGSIILNDFKTPNSYLKMLALIKNLSMSQIARLSSLSLPTVSLIMNGTTSITKNTSEKLGKVFNIDAMYLYKRQLQLKIKQLEDELNSL